MNRYCILRSSYHTGIGEKQVLDGRTLTFNDSSIISTNAALLSHDNYHGSYVDKDNVVHIIHYSGSIEYDSFTLDDPSDPIVQFNWDLSKIFIGIVTASGKCYATSYNACGELGNGKTTMPTGNRPIQLPFNNVKKICSITGTLDAVDVVVPYAEYQFTVYPKITIFVLLKNGDVYSCGYNGHGECGLGHTNVVTTFTKINISNVVDIDVESSSTNPTLIMFLKSDGTVYAHGYCAATIGGSNIGIGFGPIDGASANNAIKSPRKYDNVSDIVSISAKRQSTMLKSDGTVYRFGLDEINSQILYTPTIWTEATNLRPRFITGDLLNTFIVTQNGKAYNYRDRRNNNNGFEEVDVSIQNPYLQTVYDRTVTFTSNSENRSRTFYIKQTLDDGSSTFNGTQLTGNVVNYVTEVKF